MAAMARIAGMGVLGLVLLYGIGKAVPAPLLGTGWATERFAAWGSLRKAMPEYKSTGPSGHQPGGLPRDLVLALPATFAPPCPDMIYAFIIEEWGQSSAGWDWCWRI